MLRINVYEKIREEDYGYVTPKLAGWFDWHKAARWSDADYNGDGSGGVGRGQAVILTSGGKWVLERWSRWQNESDRYEYITADEARDWLLRNNEDAAVAECFGEIAEEEDRRPGRPEIGGRISTAIGDELLANVDAYAKAREVTRAEAIRSLLEDALAYHAHHASA